MPATRTLAERNRTAAIAELERNGIKVPKEKNALVDPAARQSDVDDSFSPAIDVPGIALNVKATTGRPGEEHQSTVLAAATFLPSLYNAALVSSLSESCVE